MSNYSKRWKKSLKNHTLIFARSLTLLFYSLFTSWSPSFLLFLPSSLFLYFPLSHIFIIIPQFWNCLCNALWLCSVCNLMSCLRILLVFCVFLCVFFCILPTPHQIYLGSSGHQKCIWINHHYFFLCWFSLVSYTCLVCATLLLEKMLHCHENRQNIGLFIMNIHARGR